MIIWMHCYTHIGCVRWINDRLVTHFRGKVQCARWVLIRRLCFRNKRKNISIRFPKEVNGTNENDTHCSIGQIELFRHYVCHLQVLEIWKKNQFYCFECSLVSLCGTHWDFVNMVDYLICRMFVASAMDFDHVCSVALRCRSSLAAHSAYTAKRKIAIEIH